ncbi:MAG: hypothetical protein RMN52_09515 [Anaerolineae bacterium]|nr:hypothetical protein [Candidatus Roseilinea sp.]MDW8450231.1 hypothetical protein [Anaerolineae bacterium]
MSYSLVVVDTTQIQSYIFASNRLAENIGASWLVKQATGSWALETVRRVAPRNNISDATKGALTQSSRIESGALDAEVIYAAGANVLVIFTNDKSAGEFIRQLSRRVLCAAPGLTLLFARQSFDWSSSGDLFRAVQDAFKDVERQKAERAFDAPLLGLGVTAACRSTGLPANALYSYGSDKHHPLASGIVAKLRAADHSHDELRALFQGLLGDEYDFPRDFDDLGRSKGEQSFIAVAHVDGNGFGQAMVELGKQHQRDHRAYITAMRKRSDALDEAAREALHDTVQALIYAIQRGQDKNGAPTRLIGKDAEREDTLKLKNKAKNEGFLPFRPLVFGGDDTTFVCDGRLGLSLATDYLALFADRAEQKLKQAGVLLNGETPSACAGVAIVKSRYPFSRAYHLADELCSSAKRFRAQEKSRANQEPGCFLDWHFALSGLIGNIEDVRRREYTTQHGSLTLRPVSLEPLTRNASLDARTARSWTVVERLVQSFQGEAWAERRNKVKALREALREGPQAVERFALIYRLGKPALPELTEGDKGEHRNTGWLDGADVKDKRCAYFDAIELADLYVPLQLKEMA